MKIFSSNKFTRIPDAILFDTDNTLYPYDPAHAAAQNSVRKKVVNTFSIKEDDFDHAFKEARQQVKSQLKGHASSHSRLLYMQRMLEIMGLGSQALLALDFEQTYWRTFLSNAIIFDEVKETLDELRLLGVPTAIVTDLTSQIQFRKIVYFGLEHDFDCIVTSEESGFDKPHAASFELALKKLRPAGDCIWMIGDNAVNDIRGAKEAIGALTLQKVHHGVALGENENKPDAAFNEFKELRKFIASLGGKNG